MAERRNLFGGYMSVDLPSNVIDVSDLRSVPDHQEVFNHPVSDQSMIIEILEHVTQPDEDAVRVHLNDLCESNDASDVQTGPPEPVDLTMVAMRQCNSVFTISSSQRITKFKELAANTVHVHLAVFRLPQFQSDIVFSFNDPVIISPESSSHSNTPSNSLSSWTMDDFRRCVYSLTINNTELFG